MAIHYDKKTGRFKDDSGRFVARDRAMRSSIARREYEDATKPKKGRSAGVPSSKPKSPGPKPAARKRAPPIPAKKPLRPVVAKDAAPSKAKPVKPKPTPVRIPKPAPAKKKPAVKKKPPAPPRIYPPPPPPPSVRYYPPHVSDQEGIIEEFPDNWFPDPGAEDDFDWDDIDDLWGGYEDDDTTSAGPDGGES